MGVEDVEQTTLEIGELGVDLACTVPSHGKEKAEGRAETEESLDGKVQLTVDLEKLNLAGAAGLDVLGRLARLIGKHIKADDTAERMPEHRDLASIFPEVRVSRNKAIVNAIHFRHN